MRDAHPTWLLRSAIEQGQTLTTISENYARVAGIRRIEGERTELADKLARQAARYQRQLAALREFAAPSMLGTETRKLNEGWQRKFDALAHDARSALDQLSGIGESATYQLQVIDDQIQQVRTKDLELQRAAKASRGRLSYTPLTDAQLDDARADAVASLRLQTLQTLYQALGQSVPSAESIAAVHRQFEAIRRDAPALGIALDLVARAEAKAIEAANPYRALLATVPADVQSVREAAAGPEALRQRLSADIAAGMVALENTWDLTAAEEQAAKLLELTQQRWQLDLQNTQALLAAGQQIHETVRGLRIGDLSPLSGQDQLALAKSKFETDLLAAQAGDSQAAGRIGADLSAYLQSANRMYPTGSAPYQDIFKDATGRADTIATYLSDAPARLAEVQGRTVDALNRLIGVLEKLANGETAAPEMAGPPIPLAAPPAGVVLPDQAAQARQAPAMTQEQLDAFGQVISHSVLAGFDRGFRRQFQRATIK